VELNRRKFEIIYLSQTLLDVFTYFHFPLHNRRIRAEAQLHYFVFVYEKHLPSFFFPFKTSFFFFLLIAAADVAADDEASVAARCVSLLISNLDAGRAIERIE